MSPEKFTSMRLSKGWQRRGPGGRKSIIGGKGPLGLVLTPSLIPSDGVNTHGPKRTSVRVPNGLGTCGALAPWTTSN